MMVGDTRLLRVNTTTSIAAARCLRSDRKETTSVRIGHWSKHYENHEANFSRISRDGTLRITDQRNRYLT